MFALWPATQQIGKSRVSNGKTQSIGLTDVEQQSGGSNVVAALQSIEKIISKIP